MNPLFGVFAPSCMLSIFIAPHPLTIPYRNPMTTGNHELTPLPTPDLPCPPVPPCLP